MKRRLPPLLALRAFESAGRHISFSAAARELNVTQGAISRQVKILENHLEYPLFRREARGVSLTPAGQRYLDMVSSVFDRIEQAAPGDATRHRTLSISVLPSCATLWLLPRLSAFARLHPDITLQVSTSQQPVDFKRDAVDLALRVGHLPGRHGKPGGAPFATQMVEDWNGIDALHLWDEEIAPLCSRKLLQGLTLHGVADLQKTTLIHNASRPDWWPAWLSANGGDGSAIRPAQTTLRVGQRFMAVQAARDSQGVACVPTVDIAMLEWKDEMAFPFASVFHTGDAYFLLHRADTAKTLEIQVFHAWLVSLGERQQVGALPGA